LEYILHDAILSLLDIHDSTRLSMLRLLSDKDYRARVVPLIQDPLGKKFWTHELGRYTPAFQKEAIATITYYVWVPGHRCLLYREVEHKLRLLGCQELSRRFGGRYHERHACT
jgi:hypothetical protein